MITASDLSAKLLAQENINVVRANAKTASFDVISRVLTIPLWKDMTPEIEDMMQCHEVGHALFTDGAIWLKSINSFDKTKQRVVHGYMNVVEDARIEKLMKRRFPGCRKSFYAAYKQLVQRDFFKIKNKNVNELMFIDRMNLYFKGGLTLGIKFNAEEKAFVSRVDNIESMEEAMQVAFEIYEFCKAKAKERKSETAHEDLTFDNFEDSDDEVYFDEDEDEGEPDESADGPPARASDKRDGEPEENNKCSGASDDAEIDEEIESQTDKNLSMSMQDLADDSVEYTYYEVSTALVHDPIVSYKKILQDTADATKTYDYAATSESFESFMKDSERMVSYLVKEFEMRKSAQAYHRAQISKSGSLNMNKIHQYKLSDDIFKRVMSIPDGKNHGMIFLLDWSGSMMDMIMPTLKQVINLVMFCRRINIPFEVYAFTGQYISSIWDNDKYYKNNIFTRSLRDTADKNLIFSDGMFNLLNLFSSKMTNNEFNTVARRFCEYNVQNVTGYALGDTPLNEALLYMLDFIPDFKRRNNIEKLTLVTLTDGQGGPLDVSTGRIVENAYRPGSSKRMKIKNFVRDTKTQKTYSVTGEAQSQTEALLKMIKDRYDIASLGFYLCENRQRILASAFKDNVGEYGTTPQIDEMRQKFRDQGFYSMMGTGRDDLFVVPASSTKILDDELEVDSSASAAAIARKFGKNLNNKKHSRVLLDRFISYVA